MPPIKTRLLTLSFLCVAAAAPSAALEPESQPRITAIEVETSNIFTPDEEKKGAFPYRFSNKVHAVTRQRFVETMLLFKVGDPLDPKVFEETERNLRATELFRIVKVEAVGTTVRVTTRDRWTLLPKIGVAKQGGVTTFLAGVEEKNFLGNGQDVAVQYEKGTERTSFSAEFDDRQFLWQPYLRFHAIGAKLSDGQEWLAEFGRPFYALAVPWSARGSYHYFERDQTLWAGGGESAIWSDTTRTFRLDGGKRLHGSEQTAARLSAFVDYDDTTLRPGPLGAPPEEGSRRRFLFIGPGYERAAVDPIVVRQVDKVDLDEDFNLATAFSVELGLSPGGGDLTGAARMKALASSGVKARTGFGIATLSAETRYQDGPRAGKYGLDLRWWFTSPGFTVATRLTGTALSRPDPEVQLHLDSSDGMRGYRLHSVSGTSQVMANVEFRKLMRSDWLSLVSMGIAAFVDAGSSWGPPDGHWDLLDVGAGFRVGLPRSGVGAVFRLDVSYACLKDPLGRRGWLWSMGATQAF
jgi:hypothetical protein